MGRLWTLAYENRQIRLFLNTSVNADVQVGQITLVPQRRHRPAPGGVSVGHPNAESGTLGCLVEKMGNHYILSNNIGWQ